MSIFSASSAEAVTNRVKADQAARASTARRVVRPAQATARAEDELLLSVEDGANVSTTRSLKGNADQETADDREQQDHYNTPHNPPTPPERPRLDVEG